MRVPRFFWVELSASVATLCGIAIGSTTFYGALCYAVSMIFWFWLMVGKPLWGLAPLNIATLGIIAVNLWRTW